MTPKTLLHRLGYLFTLAAVGCSNSPTPDAGTTDAGVTAADTGPRADAAVPTDAAAPTDVGTPTDTATATDVAAATDTAMASDSATTTDVPVPSDATAAFDVVNGCNPGDYVDLSAASATRTVIFTLPTYTPKCARIAAGQSVTFSGTFSFHPLTPGVPPGQTGTASPSNPITVTNTGTTASFTFPTAGFYPYYCANHASMGMVGVIQVM